MKTLLDKESLVFKPPELGCVLYLPEFPGSGSKIHDRSPYGHVCTITGATWHRLPSGLWYLDFDGTDDRVDCGNNSALRPTSAVTVEVWFKPDNTAGGYVVCMPYTTTWSNPYYSYAIYYLTDERLMLGWNIGGASDSMLGTIGDVPTGVWHHISLVFDGVNMTCYVDMSIYKTAAAAGVIAYSGAPKLALGTRNIDALGEYSKGYIALPRVYNRALTALEIQNHFGQEKHLFGVW